MGAEHPRRSVFKRDLAKQFRANPTDAERRLWSLLRRRQLFLRFRRQQAIGPYIADFFCPAAKLIIELDGDQHGGEAGMARDAMRTRWLEQRGFIVLRFPNAVILKNDSFVMDEILRVMAAVVPLPEAPSALRPSLKGRVE
jgi:very-short-patch-repair endonuclease